LAGPLKISGYRIIRTLGHGGMSDIYLAEHVLLNRKVAIKVLRDNLTDDPGVRVRFQDEGRNTARLSHVNIAILFDCQELDGKLVHILEYVPGRSMAEMISQETGPIPYERSITLFVQVLSALSYAHAQGIIHRDLKPSNILVTDGDHVKVTDFGIAIALGSLRHTKAGARIGTPYYMSPEQIKSPSSVDHRSDIYSLGITFYEMLVGRTPFEDIIDSNYAIEDAIINKELPDPRTFYPHIPGQLVDIIQRATAKSPDKRYAACQEFSVDLLNAMNELSNPHVGAIPKGSRRTPPPEEISDVPPRSPIPLIDPAKYAIPTIKPWAIAAGSAGAILVLIILISVHFTKQDPPQTSSKSNSISDSVVALRASAPDVVSRKPFPTNQAIEKRKPDPDSWVTPYDCPALANLPSLEDGMGRILFASHAPGMNSAQMFIDGELCTKRLPCWMDLPPGKHTFDWKLGESNSHASVEIVIGRTDAREPSW